MSRKTPPNPSSSLQEKGPSRNQLNCKPKLPSLLILPLAKKVCLHLSQTLSDITADSIALANIILLVEEDQLGSDSRTTHGLHLKNNMNHMVSQKKCHFIPLKTKSSWLQMGIYHET
jgi:hypothetical protein